VEKKKNAICFLTNAFQFVNVDKLFLYVRTVHKTQVTRVHVVYLGQHTLRSFLKRKLSVIGFQKFDKSIDILVLKICDKNVLLITPAEFVTHKIIYAEW